MMKHGGAPAVHAAHEPAGPEVVGDVLDRRVRLVGGRLVVHRQDHAGHRLDDERGQRRRAERLEPVDVAGDVAEEEVPDRRRRGPSAPRASRSDRGSAPRVVIGASPSAARRLDRIEPGLRPVDVHARERVVPLVDPRRRRRCPRPPRPRTGCRGRGGGARPRTAKRSSARTGGPAMRLPSVSYWPPWQGQPKLDGCVGIRLDVAVLVFVASRRSRPVRLHRAAEVHAVVREDREARLVLRLRVREDAVVTDEDGDAARRRPPRARSGTSRSSTRPRGRASSGPRSWSLRPWFRNGGSTVKPSTGTVTSAPITAPRPSVVASRNFSRV